jgi:hypothetical protein
MGLHRSRFAAALAFACLAAMPSPARPAEDPPPWPMVGMTRTQFGAILARTDPTVLSDIGGVVALESKDPEVEFERYVFTLPSGEQPARLWQITIGYRMPADRARFTRAEASLTERFGAPTGSTSRPADHGQPPIERRVWDTGDAVATLAGCPDGETTDEAARLQVTIVDRRLQRLGLAQRRAGQPKKH